MSPGSEGGLAWEALRGTTQVRGQGSGPAFIGFILGLSSRNPLVIDFVELELTGALNAAPLQNCAAEVVGVVMSTCEHKGAEQTAT